MAKKNTPLIMWQKWADPFGSDDEIRLDVLEEYPNSEEALAEDILEDEVRDKTDLLESMLKNKSNIKVMATPMGIIPITENTASSKIFNFWVGHTNFNITKKVASLIEETDGVESLDIFTRYRFRISVGKAFKDSTVMRNINDNVYEYLG